MPNMQMNFRIDAELKRRGDERFARLGCTPSEALRRFYEMLEQLRRAMMTSPKRPCRRLSASRRRRPTP